MLAPRAPEQPPPSASATTPGEDGAGWRDCGVPEHEPSSLGGLQELCQALPGLSLCTGPGCAAPTQCPMSCSGLSLYGLRPGKLCCAGEGCQEQSHRQGSEGGNRDMGMGTAMRTCQHSSVVLLMPTLLSTILLLSLGLWGGPTGICVAPAWLSGLFPPQQRELGSR